MRLLPAIAVLSLLLSACGREPAPGAPATATSPAVPLAGDPAQVVLAASQRFGQLRSFHATLHMQGPRTLAASMDFVAPDRYRLQTDEGAQTIIGGTFFLQRAGEVRQVPVPPGLLAQWRSPLPADARPAELQVEDLGEDRVAGAAARRYRVRHASAAPEGMLYWVGTQGLPVRIERQAQTQGKAVTVTVEYSRFNDESLRIAVP